MMVLPLAHYLVPGERLSPMKAGGFIVGFIGTLVLIGIGSLRFSGGDLEALARIACVAAALSYACGHIITRLG